MAVHFMQGDARKLLLGDDCLHLTLGSPPYLKARKYDRDDIARDVAPWVEFMLDATRDRPFALDMRQRIHLLREAVAAAADQDFDESVRGAYRLMIGFTTDLLVISQAVAARRIDQVEQGINQNHDTVVRDALDAMLPQIERLHHHLVALTRAYATTSHTQDLAITLARLTAETARDTIKR